MRRKIKKKCGICGKMYNQVLKIKGQIVCQHCKKKILLLIPNGKKRFSMEKALSKTYRVYGYLSNENRIVACASFPSILVGHKIKITLED